MQKAIWISFALALVVVNALAEAVYYFADLYIAMVYRITMVLGITMITAIFVGAMMLIGKLEEEVPLSGHTSDTLGPDKIEPREKK
jgi:hypothetical protein